MDTFTHYIIYPHGTSYSLLKRMYYKRLRLGAREAGALKVSQNFYIIILKKAATIKKNIHPDSVVVSLVDMTPLS